MNKIKNNQPKVVDENSQNCVSRSSLFKKFINNLKRDLKFSDYFSKSPKAGRLVNNLGDE